MRKRMLLAGLAAGLGLCLSGCIFDPVDKLYALPALPQEYKDLQATIDATMSKLGAEYATINYGSNTSTIQLLDMDGDGRQETAAVFLRVVASAEEKPMRVCLFRQGSDQIYRQSAILEGAGTSINSVAYEDLTGDGSRELIVSWQLSTGVHSLSAYSFGVSGANELMSATYNEGYMTVDLDEDGSQELIVFQRDITGEGYNVAEYYDYQGGVMVLSSTGTLSDGLKDVVRSEAGRLSDGRLGVYVTLEIETGWLTDVLTLEPGGLVNVTRDPESGVSATTCWSGTEASTTDINGDGVPEIPRPQRLASVGEESAAAQYLIYWQQFDSTGAGATSLITYHAFTDGWYLTLPNGWNAGNIAVARDDSSSSRGERAVSFYYRPDQEEEEEPKKFLTIYYLTGSNRTARSKLPGRTVLASDSSAIYCASLDTRVWDCGLDEGELAQRFKLITAAWSNR